MIIHIILNNDLFDAVTNFRTGDVSKCLWSKFVHEWCKWSRWL